MLRTVVGIHLAGSNAKKTALAVFHVGGRTIHLIKVHDRIGSLGMVFSDERIIDILRNLTSEREVAEVFVDCPISLPPCVECTRPSCPSVLKCDDVSVAMMLSIANKDPRKGARKLRPVNPQSHRLWDVFFGKQLIDETIEPTYSANLAPLVVRARTLQRRLNSVHPNLKLKETSVLHALSVMAKLGILNVEDVKNFRRFENGADSREKIIESLLKSDCFKFRADDMTLEVVVNSLEAFCSMMTGLISGFHVMGATIDPPEQLEVGRGWVFLPSAELTELANAVDSKKE